MDDTCGRTQLHMSVVRHDSDENSTSSSPSPLYLIMLTGTFPGAMLQLTPSGTRLGRAADNTLQLSENSISRYHALIKADPDGQVRLKDLDSTNGTFVNGRRLPPHASVPVRDGDKIQFGAELLMKFVKLDPCDERHQREMFERTVRDSLTGLYNRAYFLEKLGPLTDSNALRGMGVAVLMMDIDHFKRINDDFGHPIGDLVLREVANVLRTAMRSDDLVARYGGEEFVVALPVAAPDQATERAERIRASLGERRVIAGDHSIRVTASIGLSFAPAGRPKTPPVLIQSADQGLYQAKSAGRNRVVFGPEVRLRPRDLQTAIPSDF